MKTPARSLSLLALLALAACPETGGCGGGGEGPPPRTLVTHRLFGDMPADNRILDPNVTVTGNGWFAMKGTTYVPVLRQAFAHTPTGQNVLTIPKDTVGATAVVLAGMTRMGRGPLDASVWLGRPAAGSAYPDPSVALVGFDPAQGKDVAVDLAPEDGSEQTLDGIVWKRFAVRVEGGLAGWGMLTLEDRSYARLSVTGPVVVKGEPTTTLVRRPGAPSRDLTPGEARAMGHLREVLKSSLEAPGRRESERRREALHRFSGPAGRSAGPAAPQPWTARRARINVGASQEKGRE